MNSGDLEIYCLNTGAVLKFRSQHWSGEFGTHSVRVWGVLVCTLVAVSAVYSLNSLTEFILLLSVCSAELELSSINTSRLKNLRSGPAHGCQCPGQVVLTFSNSFGLFQ